MIRMDWGWAYPADDRFMASQMTDDGRYQSSHLAKALEYVTNFSVALDCGAHVGTWSRPLANLFARVIAVEPSPDTFEALQLNMMNFGCRNVELVSVALGQEPGFVHMRLDLKAQALHNTGGRYVVDGGDIPVMTIDSWRMPDLGFLKLDIEGSEVAALRGASETLMRCKPIVLFEDKGFWKRYGLPRDAPQKFLTSIGYRHLTRVSMDEIWGWVQ